MTGDQLREHARDLVATWPPLTADQRGRLAALLRPGPVPDEEPPEAA